jgi:NMD protein affecting ribosome stability and mRNA decay
VSTGATTEAACTPLHGLTCCHLTFACFLQTFLQTPKPREQKVKLVDAGFIWTEPHSKRLKVKLTIQDEVMNGTILQQGFVVEFVVENHMCLECNRANANPNSWTACVQVGAQG